MLEELRQTKLVELIKETLGKLPDARTGQNTQYEMEDAGLGAFSVFFTQSASFLEHQETLKKAKGRSNAESIFGIKNIPCDNQIRNMLDPVSPEVLNGVYRSVYKRLKKGKVIDGMRSFGRNLLVAIDGTEYFSSKNIHCEGCNQRVLKDGKINYYHSAITPVIVQPGNEHVISLEPEFIRKQDGYDKQDCEIAAGKRWLEAHGEYYAKENVTLLGDDLYCHEPFCKLVRSKGFHFIFVCKPESHEMLYETVKFLEANGTLSSHTKRHWNGKHGEIHTYRYANELPLTAEPKAMQVNWCELTITHEKTGEVIYRNAFATDFAVSETTVEAIVRDGRARWKIENENNNVLKTKGYHLEHNFGHGDLFLASFLLSLNLLAFLFHTVLHVADLRYQLIRKELRKRQKFFAHLEALMSYFVFDDWNHLLDFMIAGLEIEVPPAA